MAMVLKIRITFYSILFYSVFRTELGPAPSRSPMGLAALGLLSQSWMSSEGRLQLCRDCW